MTHPPLPLVPYTELACIENTSPRMTFSLNNSSDLHGLVSNSILFIDKRISSSCINFFDFYLRKLRIYIYIYTHTYIFKERKARVDPYVRRVSVCILIGLTRRAR